MIIEIPKGTPEKKIRALLKKKKETQTLLLMLFLVNCLN